MHPAAIELTPARRPRRAALGYGLRPWGPLLLGVAALALMLASVLLLTGVDSAGPSPLVPRASTFFPGWLAGPLRGLFSSVPSSAGANGIENFLFLTMGAAYLALICTAQRLPRGVVVGVVGLCATLIFLAPPFRDTDIFNYLDYSRLSVVQHINPYVYPPRTGNPYGAIYALSNWHGLRSPYGPLFTLAVDLIATTSPAVSFWLAKLFTCLAFGGCCWLLMRLANRQGINQQWALSLVAFNPAVLLFGLAGFHNDFFAVLPWLCGALLLTGAGQFDPATRRRRAILGGLMLVCAASVKASMAALAPALWLRSRDKWWASLGLAAGGLVFAVLLVVFFGGHPPNLSQQSSLVSASSFPNLLGGLTGAGGDTHLVQELAQVMGVVAVAVACAAVAARKLGAMSGVMVCALASVMALPWSLPWYALWFLVPAALSKSRVVIAAAVAASMLMTFVDVPLSAGFLRSIGVVHSAISDIHSQQISVYSR